MTIKQSAYTLKNGWAELLTKAGTITAFRSVSEKPSDSVSLLIGQEEFFVEIGNLIDVKAELAKANLELVYLAGFLVSVDKKLLNEKFMVDAKPLRLHPANG